MNYAFELSNADTERLFDAVRQLRLGDSMSGVKEKLGNPDSEITLHGKFLLRKRPPGRSRYAFGYYIKRVHQDAANEGDHRIGLYFDESEHLQCISFNRVPPFFGEIISELSNGPVDYVCFTKPPVP